MVAVSVDSSSKRVAAGRAVRRRISTVCRKAWNTAVLAATIPLQRRASPDFEGKPGRLVTH
jgi:hypothetical protein